MESSVCHAFSFQESCLEYTLFSIDMWTYQDAPISLFTMLDIAYTTARKERMCVVYGSEVRRSGRRSCFVRRRPEFESRTARCYTDTGSAHTLQHSHGKTNHLLQASLSRILIYGTLKSKLYYSDEKNTTAATAAASSSSSSSYYVRFLFSCQLLRVVRRMHCYRSTNNFKVLRD